MRALCAGNNAVPAATDADRIAAARMSLIGPAFAVIGILGFSFKAILIKLAYSWAPIDAVTLLALRMIYSVPFFALMAWWASKTSDAGAMRRPGWLGTLRSS